MSIGFIILEKELDLEDPRIRKIIKVDLKEVSLVTFPANPKAVITAIKTINVEDVKEITTRRKFEKFLRDAGLSKSAAEIAASNKFNESLQGEPVDDDVELKKALATISSNFDSAIAANEISKISQRVTSYEHRIKRT